MDDTNNSINNNPTNTNITSEPKSRLDKLINSTNKSINWMFNKLSGSGLNNVVDTNKFKQLYSSLCLSLFVEGPKMLYFNHFLTLENEHKENLIITYNAILKSKIAFSTSIFILYNIIKSILWRRGYFATFFFHTRFFSFYTLMLSYYYFSKEFQINLKNSNLLNYYTKHKTYEEMYLKLKQYDDQINIEMSKNSSDSLNPTVDQFINKLKYS